MSGFHNAHAQARHSPPHVRKTAAKAARSAPASKSIASLKITIKGTKATKKAKEEEEQVFGEDDDDTGLSFLQFCAMCEKQIVVPNSSILYCSESCRRGDAAIPTADPYLSLLSSPTRMANPLIGDDMDESIGSKIPTYVPRLQPTPRTAPDGRIPAQFHNAKSDLDPTEWKPAELGMTAEKSPTKSGEWKPKLTHRPSSEATSYLSKFHRSCDSLPSKRRPMISQSRTPVSSRSTPGLSHTSTASTSSEDSLEGTPYEFVARPALSMPATSATKVSPAGKDGNDLTYKKKQIGTSMGSATGSLKKLLGTAAEAM